MPEQPSLDPFAMWRDMLGQWERGLNGVANQAMGSDEFSRAMHQVTSMSLRMQQTVGEVMAKSLQALNLPSRNDLTAISERLARIEAQLDQMAVDQHAARGHAPSAAVPAEPPSKTPRTRRPPAG
jgi:hypothetical protein